MAADVTTARAGHRADETWTIDATRTVVEFEVKTLLFRTVTGRFTDVSGQIVLDAADPALSTVAVMIGAASIATGHPRRDTRLRSAEFLDVARVPTIRFQSTGVEAVSLEHLRVTGDLTIRDMTRPAVLDARIGMQRRDERGQMGVHIMAQTTLNRHDFGVSAGSSLRVGKTLTIRLAVQASR